VTSQYDAILTFANNVLAKFVDTTCILRDTGAAVGQGSSKRAEGNGNLQKTKNCYQLCLFLFINSVDLKNNNRNYRKLF